MNTPVPPEFFLIRNNQEINSSCTFFTQIIDFIVCSLLSLKNPYFELNMRRSTAKRFCEKNTNDGVLRVSTIQHKDRCAYESLYQVGSFQRLIVTEVRGSFFHGRYFHVQRVLAMIERDLFINIR